MKLAIAAAKPDQVQPLISFLQNQAQQINRFHFRFKSLEIQILITGAGVLRTSYALTKYFQHQSVDFFIHSGLATAVNDKVVDARVYQISEDISLTHQKALSYLTGFSNGDADSEFPYENGKLINSVAGRFLPLALSITNESGEIDQGTIQSCNTDFENIMLLTQDNTAVFFTAIMEKINFLSIRAALNKNEVGEIAVEKKKEGILLLNSTLIDIILTLAE